MGLPPELLLGTSAQYTPVPCPDNEIGDCLPGFGVISLVSIQNEVNR